MNKLNLYIILLLLSCPISNYGQNSNTVIRKNISVVEQDGSHVREVVIPSSFDHEFDKLILTNKRAHDYCPNPCMVSEHLSKYVDLVKAAVYFDSTAHQESDGTKYARYISHPIFYPSLVYKDTVYIFFERNLRDDIDVFNEFVRKLSIKIENVGEAEQFAKFYLAATEDYFDSSKIILTNMNDIPESYRKVKAKETASLKNKVRPPTSQKSDRGYEVTFCTWERLSGKLKFWRIAVEKDGVVDANFDVIGLV